MISSYFFIRNIRNSLSKLLERAILLDAYRQSAQSVVFVFEKLDGSLFYIEGFFASDECLLHFPKEQSKSRKAISILKELYGFMVTSVEQAENERAFAIHLKGKQSIVFKWFGRQSNILHWDEGKVKWLLVNKLKNDEVFNYTVFHKPRTWSQEEFLQMNGELAKFIPQLGKDAIHEWSTDVHWNELSNLKDKWLKVQVLLSDLKQPTYYIIQENKRAHFSLFNFNGNNKLCLAEESDPLLAANLYFHYYYRFNRVELLREQLTLFYSNKLRALNKQIDQLSQGVVAFDERIPPNQLADIIMANLNIFKSAREVEVLNFYTQENIQVKLKERLSAVDYASLLYKKSKNRQTEKLKMLDRLAKLELELENLKDAFATIEQADVRMLLTLKEDFLPTKGLSAQQEKALEPPVFKEYECLDYKIFVGRNAKNNDELTLHFAHKEDLWLHAKDVSGSHVIVKHKAGKPFPKPVIERAAELAAFYSKRKNDSLCPVMYTLKKYVRKVKGTAAGMVRVERESVLLVVPAE
jgi:predicted ribosome quality control (RQC) complex YloA/Tae2 family protein